MTSTPATRMFVNSLFRLPKDQTLKLPIIGPFEGKPMDISGFLSQRASNAENISLLWRYHLRLLFRLLRGAHYGGSHYPRWASNGWFHNFVSYLYSAGRDKNRCVSPSPMVNFLTSRLTVGVRKKVTAVTFFCCPTERLTGPKWFHEI